MKRVPGDLKMANLEEIFKTVFIVSHRYERLAVLKLFTPLLCFWELIGLGTNPRTVMQYEASLSVVLFCSFYKTNILCFRTSVQ